MLRSGSERRAGLSMATALVRLLSVVVPKHRRSDWREEWEAELTWRWTETTRGVRPQPSSTVDILTRAVAAIPDAFHLFTREWILDVMLQDLRHTVRSLRRHPAFSVVSLSTLALCIGANAAIFSVVDAIILRPLPYPHSDRLVYVFNSYPEANEERAGNSIPDYFDRRESVDAFEEVALFTLRGGVVGEGDSRQHAFHIEATPSFFRVLGAQPHLGRLFTEAEGERGSHDKVLLSYGLWQSLFAGEGSAIGQDLAINGRQHTVVGILPQDFNYPTWDAGIWTPMAFGPGDRSDDRRYSGGPEMLALLRPGVGIEAARAQVAALNSATLERYPPDVQSLVRGAGFHTEVRSFHEDLIREVRAPLLLLWGGLLFVLMIGCANIANLLLVWTSSRLKEFATRHALGARRRRIVSQLLTESLFLTVVGGGLGLLAGSWSLHLLDAFAVYDVPRMAEVRMDLAAVAFTAMLAVVVGVMAGVLPAFRLLSGDLAEVFLAGGRTATPGRRAVSLQGLLVSVQVAVTFVLLLGAALMLTSMRNVLAVDPGFDPEAILATAVTLPVERYPDAESRIQFINSAVSEIRAQPTVEDAAMVSFIPFSGVENTAVMTPEAYTRRRDEPVFTSQYAFTSPGYFDVLGIPLIGGRSFRAGDTMDAPSVVVIDEWLARRFWPEGNAVGQRVYLTPTPDENTPLVTVVGVVGSIRQNDYVEADQTGAIYRPHTQAGLTFFRLAVKTRGEPLAAMPEVRRAIHLVDAGVFPYWVVSLEDTMRDSLIPRRTPMQLLIVSACVALLLASLGVYGVLAYSVNQRTREIGIRMALGGTTEQIVRLVGRQWGRVVGLGLLIGLGGALAATRLIASLLYQVTPTDPVVFLYAVLLVVLVALAAYLLPAWRATRVNPVETLNVE